MLAACFAEGDGLPSLQHRNHMGLYLLGQTTFPGYGVPSAMLSGVQAPEAMLRVADRS
jgi:phytoene desaturase